MSEVPLVPGSVADHTGCLLLKLGQVMFRLTEDRLAGGGLRIRHFSILQALADRGAVSQLDLGGYLRIDPATMVNSLDDLEREGFAARSRDPRDRRRHVVEITAAGLRTLAGANSDVDALDDAAFADLTTEDRAALHRILGTLSGGPALPALFDSSRERPPVQRRNAGRR